MKILSSLFFLVFIAFLAGPALGQNSADTTAGAPLWMRYPAISPDGTSIVFSYKGDLFKVPADGGRAVQLTSHEGHEFRPVWSHDGEQIAFASDRYGNYDVFILPASGGEAKRLTWYSTNDYPSGFASDGAEVLFSSWRLDDVNATTFPHSSQVELYGVPVERGRPEMHLTVPAEEAVEDPGGNHILYQDRPGGENRWRKHHTSSVTRDIWVFDKETGEHRQLTEFEGEDRDPVWADDDAFYFLSERGGDFNVWKKSLSGGAAEQVTEMEKHPVRFLSRSDAGTLCFGYDGRIFTMEAGQEPREIDVEILSDRKYNERDIVPIHGDVTEMAVSPDGKEIAFIVRGEVFVTSVDHTETKRITNTPEQERSVSFHPEEKTLLYASERDGNWGVYQASIAREEEEYFYMATLIEEEPLVEGDEDAFQPKFSPDGKEVAYLEDRTTLKVLDLKSEEQRTVLPGNMSYSYADGDQWYDWSPDGNWFLVEYVDGHRWPPAEAGLVKASGKEPPIDLTNSGYHDARPQWMMDGKMMIWFSDRDGNRSHGGLGAEMDVYGMFFTQEGLDRFNMDKAQYELWKKEQEEKDDDKKEEKEKTEPLDLELEDVEDRVERLTIHSSDLAGAVMGPDGEKLYYLSKFEQGHDLWVHKFYEGKTELLVKLGKEASDLVYDEENGNIFVLSKGNILKVDPSSGSKEGVSMSAEMTLDRDAERRFIFEHVWRQTREKFYVKDMHGVDWDYYRSAYEKFLPHINNDRDMVELLSELLGELNASHTGAYFRGHDNYGDKTASLGIYLDQSHEGKGLKVAEVLNKGPLDKADSKVAPGVIIEKIDGKTIEPGMNHYPLLNRKEGKNTLLSLYDPKKKKRWEEVMQPISLRKEKSLRYERWVDRRRRMTEQLSDGKLGYVHVHSMNDDSFRKTYKEVLGRYNARDAVIVDTRFNRGGWIHDDLATLLNGEKYLNFSPRGQENLGGEPINKWTKPSLVLVNEGNYSDAHMFPYVYKTKDIGKVLGMPVPGTATAVWWERQINRNIIFGIPQVGMKTMEGELLENRQLEPDIKVPHPPEAMSDGQDPQLKKAVEVLMEEVDTSGQE